MTYKDILVVDTILCFGQEVASVAAVDEGENGMRAWSLSSRGMSRARRSLMPTMP
jgi:hypothetical protein